MRIDTMTTGIHDLTVAEAASLRALCEGMLRGPVSLDHPLFVQWATECFPHRSSDLTMLTIAFLPRALHALLVHAERVSPIDVWEADRQARERNVDIVSHGR